MNCSRLVRLTLAAALIGGIGLISWGDFSLAHAADALKAKAPIDEVRMTIDELVVAVEQFPGDAMRRERRSKLRTIISPRFDFEEMAKLSLGTHWTELKQEERDEFVDVFSDLLARTYLARIENIRRETVHIGSERIAEPKALVKTMVTHKGEKFPIDYKLVHKGESWKVYDVIIENIGLVTNYRNEFAGIIRREQFAGLMKKLREKNAKAETGKEAA